MAGTEQGKASFAPSVPASSGGMGAMEEAKQPIFRPYVCEEPQGRTSPVIWIVLGTGVLLLVGGLVYHSAGPREAAAQPQAVNVKQMTATQLAVDASAEAAYELAHRMSGGNMAERNAAVAAVRDNPSPRLARNMAMALTAEAQKRQAQVMAEMQKNIRMSEEGYEAGPASGHR